MQFLKMLVEKFLRKEQKETGNNQGGPAIYERRSSVRLEYRVELNIQIGEERLPATLVNLTFTGLALSTKQELKPGQELILLREELGPPFNGTVRWCSKLEQEYLVGVDCEPNEERLADSWLLPALEEAGLKPSFAKEQRKLIRWPSQCMCILNDGKGITYYDMPVLDLSAGGALVECSKEFKPGDTLKFRIKKPGFSCQSVVLSVQQKESSWQCSLKFREPNESEISALISQMMSE